MPSALKTTIARQHLSAENITLNLIESHLWESANILRSPVDAANFKTYIFPLLFFKRIAAFKGSLVRCREAEQRLAEIMKSGDWLTNRTAHESH